MKRTMPGVLLVCSLLSFNLATALAADVIPEAWLVKYFGPDFADDPRAAVLADPDHDGANNYLEYITGTDPLNPDSVDRVPARVSTYAGSTQGHEDGFRTSALLNNPRDLAFDAQGRLWFTETGDNSAGLGANRVRMISPDGMVSTITGAAEPGLVDGPLAEARFNTPESPIFDSLGNTYIGD